MTAAERAVGARRRGARSLLGIHLLATLVMGCEPAPSVPDRPNLLLVTFDTTRADHLPAYGYEHGETPTLSRLARNGIRYARCYSPVPLTLPSHASLMTGLYPFHHGVRNNGTDQLGHALPTLAEQLRDRGYATGAVVAAYVLDSRFGLDRGFAHYDDDLSAAENAPKFGFAERSAGAVTDAALAWLAGLGPGPFFLWVHYYDPHSPYEPPGWQAEVAIAAPYDLEIAYADGELERLLARRADARLLRIRGDAPRAADRDPAVSRWCGHGDRDARLPRRHLPVDPDVARAVAAGTDRRHAAPHRRGRRSAAAGRGARRLLRVVVGFEKYIEAPRPELYDLRSDPDEDRNLIAEDGPRGERYRQVLQDLTALVPGMFPPAADPIELDPEEAGRLRALGYLEASAPASGIGGSLADPKDRVGLHRKVLDAQARIEAGDPASALETLGDALEEDPNNRRSLLLLLDLLNDAETRGEVVELLERRMAEPLPSPFDLRLPLAVGTAWSVEQNWSRAETALHLALEAEPEDAAANHLLARVLLALERPAEVALPHAERAYDAASGDSRHAGTLAQILGSMGRRVRALELYEAILVQNPDDVLALNNSAWLYYEVGEELDRALRRSERAVELEPDRPELHHTYACLLRLVGRGEQAERELRLSSSTSCLR
ncbi:MAG: sulfatase-like hydrolase/transferase [Deltaproteobacteria bacterium]|nr:sulfatase-like hydrolase/transferase [Deltaproteobacteria bacterium]